MNTVRAYRRDLAQYAEYLDARYPTQELVSEFVAELSATGLSPSTIARRIAAIRGFHRFAVAEGLDDSDPTQLLGSPRLGSRLPKALSVSEVTRLLDHPDVSTGPGRRDQAIFEFLYGTGCRVGELVALNLEDVDLEQATAILTGKGSKQRMVPLGAYARDSTAAYLPDRLAWRKSGGDPGALFLNQRGGRLTRQGVWTILKHHGDAVELSGKLSPHVLRHSAATHMVEGGADLRSVQEILGHATIRTTQVYTKVSPQHIREVYITSHPRGR
ncbi:MAG: tyrosine recombinase XerD [Acidimicrobiia bacterium]|nr:tyrosine recombinase XerD [Acidimicrobiia bacterium]